MRAEESGPGGEPGPEDVRRASGDVASSIAQGGGSLPRAFASVYAPCAERRRWALTYRCPHCHGHHYGLSWQPITGGPRRSGCGRLVRIVAARTYAAGVSR